MSVGRRASLLLAAAAELPSTDARAQPALRAFDLPASRACCARDGNDPLRGSLHGTPRERPQPRRINPFGRLQLYVSPQTQLRVHDPSILQNRLVVLSTRSKPGSCAALAALVRTGTAPFGRFGLAARCARGQLACRDRRHRMRGASPPYSPRPVEAAGPAESAENRPGRFRTIGRPSARFPALPAGPWKSAFDLPSRGPAGCCADSHSSYRPGDGALSILRMEAKLKTRQISAHPQS